MTQPRIALCVIARDEEAMLPDCLASAQGAVDRMLVVDTGSRDRTMELAREAGADVIEHAWADDFSAARNAALEHIHEDYLLVLDADERLAPGAAAALRRALRKRNFDLGMLPLHQADGPDAKLTDVVSGLRRIGDPILLPRLLRVTPELRWEGIVHETVASWAKGRPTRTFPIQIAHYGAHQQIRESRDKAGRNRRLLERRSRDGADGADDPNVLAYLARELQREGQLDDALATSTRSWKRVCTLHQSGDEAVDFVLPATVHAMLLLEHRRLDELGEVLQCAAANDFEHPNLWFLCGVAAEQRALQVADPRSLLADATNAYRRCLDYDGADFAGEPIPGSRGWQSRTRLGTVALRAGESRLALEAFEAALTERPGEAEAEFGFAEGLILAGRESEALERLEFWAEQDHVDAWLLLSLAALGLGRSADAATFGERAVDRGGKQKLLAPHRQDLLNELAESLCDASASPAGESEKDPSMPPAAPTAKKALAWPIYGLKSELDELLTRYGRSLADEARPLLLVHDARIDGEVEAAIAELEAAYERCLPAETPLDIELLDDPIGEPQLATLREIVDTVIELPSSGTGDRRRLLEALRPATTETPAIPPTGTQTTASADVFGRSYHIEESSGVLTHEAALQRILARGVEIATVIDLGAAAGNWSRTIKQSLLPDARFHLVEAQPRWRDALEKCVSEVPGMSVAHAAIAERDGECWFQIPDENPYGGRAYESPSADGLVKVPAVGIDAEVERQALTGPFAIKFDIHGLECQVLNGARETLKDTNLLVMEMLNYGDEGRYFPELLAHVTELGFQCVDIAEPMWRPHDGAFWQLDMFFVPMARPEASYRGW